ncbi:olfactory receptor 14A16-like isoform X1 [Mauremys mutica]|uniref:olfactory receptor 14A16-like isoform X1 n=1 Tax=Mauremys mutica TaxID=74926 RepID=UPI001D15EE77|nr:olfactory receptor 14A16-like isoform X1 [Mauremys mutica]
MCVFPQAPGNSPAQSCDSWRDHHQLLKIEGQGPPPVDNSALISISGRFPPSHSILRKKMSNQTTITEFLLLGFSDIPELQILHFVVFLVLYLASLLGNLLIITAIALNHQLHTPMYFFLMNLSILDLGTISVTIPKSMANSLMNTRLISYSGCVAQVFLVFFFASADFAILTIMAYDRYVAICQPLHYETVMNRRACVQMAASAWISVILYSAVHTGNTFAISFCGGNMVDQFFCEVPQLLKLACSNSDLSEVGFLIFSVCLASSCFLFIIVSYVQIFTTVLRIPSEQGRHKAFSTCIPHLIVVSLFICTGTFAYLKPISSSTSGLDLMVAVLYSVLPPMTNPIIYSMRNKELKGALSKLIGWRLFSKNKMSIFLRQ